MRGPLFSAKVTGAMASITASGGASRIASHEPKRSHSVRNARASVRWVVRWESIVETSSCIGSRRGTSGRFPYSATSSSYTIRIFSSGGRSVPGIGRPFSRCAFL